MIGGTRFETSLVWSSLCKTRTRVAHGVLHAGCSYRRCIVDTMSILHLISGEYLPKPYIGRTTTFESCSNCWPWSLIQLLSLLTSVSLLAWHGLVQSRSNPIKHYAMDATINENQRKYSFRMCIPMILTQLSVCCGVGGQVHLRVFSLWQDWFTANQWVYALHLWPPKAAAPCFEPYDRIKVFSSKEK